MIDRENVMDALRRCPVNKCDGCPYKETYDKYGYGCLNELDMDALELLEKQGWNVLTEDAEGVIHGLPGDDGQYLMTDGKDIWIDDYVDGVDDGIILDSGRDIREIMAWMYMPVLPKKDRW